MPQRRNKTSFKKGRTPWNKNKKGIHLSRKSEFKKGNIPANYRGIQYHKNWGKVKQVNGKKIGNAKLVWEKENGKLPKGYIIFHKDGNKWNDNITNLEPITRRELIFRNDPKKI